MKKFWRNASFRLKLGLFITLFFLILGFLVFGKLKRRFSEVM